MLVMLSIEVGHWRVPYVELLRCEEGGIASLLVELGAAVAWKMQTKNCTLD